MAVAKKATSFAAHNGADSCAASCAVADCGACCAANCGASCAASCRGCLIFDNLRLQRIRCQDAEEIEQVTAMETLEERVIILVVFIAGEDLGIAGHCSLGRPFLGSIDEHVSERDSRDNISELQQICMSLFFANRNPKISFVL